MSASQQYISVRETAQLLGISERKVMQLIESKELQAYRIADQFLRLKRSEVVEVRNSGDVESETIKFAYTQPEKVQDFFRYNDFYLIAIAIILALLYVIFFV